jgi:hypothetical protein
MKRLALLAVAVAIFGSSSAFTAPINPVIPFSIKHNLEVDKKYALRFSFYDAEEEGNEIWWEVGKMELTSKKIAHDLGIWTPFEEFGVDFSRQMWVQVSKKNRNGTYTLIADRAGLAVVPYAHCRA